MNANDHSGSAKVWLITGAGGGVGSALVDAVRDRGAIAVGGQRRVTADPHTVPLDLTDSSSCAAAVDAVVATHGRIDVLANVAGIGLVGSVEETEEKDARLPMETNFWGPLRLIRAALPHFRDQRSGHVINVSSLSGRTAAAGVSAYAASKFALEALSEALAVEAGDFGVRVTIVEPGGIRTRWVDRALAGEGAAPSEYPSVQRVQRVLERSRGAQMSSAADVAARICEVAESPTGPLRIVVGDDAYERIRSYHVGELELVDKYRLARSVSVVGLSEAAPQP